MHSHRQPFRILFAASISFILSLSAIIGVATATNATPHAVHPSDWCPEARLSISPGSGYTGDTVEFSYYYSNTNGNAVSISSWTVSYSWISASVNLGTASVPGDGSHTFYDSEILPGSAQTATITVSGDGQASGDWFSSTCTWNPWDFSVVQLPAAPTIVATASVTSGTVPLTIEFASTTTAGLAPFTYSWDFGDGTTGTGSSTSHTYTTAGSFDAKVIVTDSRERSSSDSVQITATAASSGNPGGGSQNGGGGGSGGTPSASASAVDYTPYMDGAIILVVLVVVVVAIALLVRSQGRSPPRAPK